MLLCVAAAEAIEPVREELDGGSIDWTGLRLVASAVGRPSSGAVATPEVMEADARSELGPRMLDLARQVRVESGLTAGDLIRAGDAVSDRVADNLALWEVFEARYYTSGRVELDGALPLQAWLRPALADWASGAEQPHSGEPGVSGLVVDARGLQVRPALAPKILDSSGQLLYSVRSLSELAASQRSPAVWVRDPADVAAARRAGDAPLFVKAASTADGSDLVLGPIESQVLRDAAVKAPFLVQGNVVVVVDG